MQEKPGEHVPGYSFRTGEEAEKSIQERETAIAVRDAQRTAEKRAELKEKFDSVSEGYIVMLKGMKEQYTFVSKDPETMKIKVEIKDENGYQYGTEVSASEIVDAYLPKSL